LGSNNHDESTGYIYSSRQWPYAFMKNDSNNQSRSEEFDTWLNQLLLSEELSFQQKQEALIHWDQVPQARSCHPREEHLLPLHVCFGAAMAANLKAINVFNERLLGVKTSAFLWQ